MERMLLHHLLVGSGGERPALVHGEDIVSYQDVADGAQAMASALHGAGVRRGDRVCVFLPKSIPECIAIFAPSLTDAVVVPINPLLAPAQVLHILSDCEARALITDRAGYTTLTAQFGDQFERIAIVLVDGKRESGDPASLYDLATKHAAPPPPAAIGEDLAAILYTSGSTGKPKGVMLSHTNLIAGTRIVRSYLGISPQDRILSVLPLSFDYGLNQLLTAAEQRAQLVLLTFRMGDDVVRALAKHEITGLAGVPTLWAILTRAAPSLTRTQLPHLRYVTNSGGPVPKETIKRLSTLLPQTRIFLMYGLTEAFRSSYLDPDLIEAKPGSIGKAIPECELFVLTEGNRIAAPGEHGILVHRGPTVSLGYWRRPEETAATIRQNPLRPATEGRDLVCVSGDIAYADEDGHLYVVGRNDGMIKSAGYRISPSEVEDVLMSCGPFRQVAVIGLPDPTAGYRVHAVAVASAEVSIPDVLLKASRQLAAYMLPKAIDLVDALPQTPNGKVDVKKLVVERTARD
jgi:acyl-CoA ligase (AMP-forming) (exosortase A-associated)